MRRLKHLFDNNVAWSEKTLAQDPTFFERLSQQQSPDYLWIGCADSRVPANQIVGMEPGELFVHRNVANMVIHTDLNCLSVMHYAIDVLKVKHIIVCGHYGCGGVKAAMLNQEFGLIDNWLRHIADVHIKHRDALDEIEDEGRRVDRLCELNVIEQVLNVSRTSIVRDAWRRGAELTVHGWVYGLHDGIIRDLAMCIEGIDEVEERYVRTIATSEDGLA